MGCRFSGPWVGGENVVNGRHLSQLSKQDVLRILAAYEHPITMQIKTRRGCHLQDSSTHDDRACVLPLSLQNLNLPLHPSRMTAVDSMSRVSPTYQDRHHWRHLPVQQDHCDEGMYLPTTLQDTVDMGLGVYQGQDLMSRDPKGPGCLLGCCNRNLEEPGGFHSQTEDEDIMAENHHHGYLPLHHELDSGLGWTDGSLHQGDLSGLDTEDGGLDDCHPYSRGLVPAGCGGHGFGRGSPSSESYISSELSDSGFCSVSTGEFRRFQRLLEKRMRLYNSRLHHQVEPCEKRERRDSCPKSHRELLEAIPEALTMQPLHQNTQPGEVDGTDPAMGLAPCGLFRVSSVQFRKADQPCLNRHSSSSGALFNPSHAHTPLVPMVVPVLSTCSTPSSHRRPSVLRQQQHQTSNSAGMLRRSRTLYYRPPPHEYRRRASHPTFPSYSALTLHHCGGKVQPMGVEQRELGPGISISNPAGLTISPHQHPATLSHHLGTMPHGPSYNNTNHLPHQDWPQLHERSITTEQVVTEEEREIMRANKLETKMQHDLEADTDQHLQGAGMMARERKWESVRESVRESTLSLPPQQGDINETWPKPASRQSQGSGCGGGLYSTLELHSSPGAGSMPKWEANDEKRNTNTVSTSNTNTHPHHIPNQNQNTRLSRSQLLRNRASRLADERGGMSTDEETNTEMLQGRYWSRTERREHLLVAREQRQQQRARGAAALRDGGNNRGGTLSGAVMMEEGTTDNPVCGTEQVFAEGRCNTVLELSQRKLSHLRNRKLLDDWTTVEELLTHGTRLGSGEGVVCPSNLLTVTTV